MLRRRALLAGAGAASAALAGCNSVFGDGDSSPSRQVPGDWTPAPGEWGGPTYDQANSGHNPHATPPGDEPTVAWETESPRLSIAVAADTVYARQSSTLRGLAAEDGDERFRVSRLGGSLYRYVDGRLYDHTGSGLEALTLDGDPEWDGRVDLDGDLVGLVERDGYVYVSTGTDAVRRYDADTGASVGDAYGFDVEVGGLANSDGTLYAALADGLAAFEVDDDGALTRRWRREADHAYRPRSTGVAIGDGLAVVSEVRRNADGSAGGSAFSAFDVDGTHLGTLEFDHPVTVGAVDDVLYVVTHRGTDSPPVDGTVRAYDGTEERWAVDLAVAPGWLVLADETLYVGGGIEDPAIAALDAGGGDTRWTYEGAFPLAAVDETIYAATDDGRLVALRD